MTLGRLWTAAAALAAAVAVVEAADAALLVQEAVVAEQVGDGADSGAL